MGCGSRSGQTSRATRNRWYVDMGTASVYETYPVGRRGYPVPKRLPGRRLETTLTAHQTPMTSKTFFSPLFCFFSCFLSCSSLSSDSYSYNYSTTRSPPINVVINSHDTPPASLSIYWFILLVMGQAPQAFADV